MLVVVDNGGGGQRRNQPPPHNYIWNRPPLEPVNENIREGTTSSSRSRPRVLSCSSTLNHAPVSVCSAHPRPCLVVPWPRYTSRKSPIVPLWSSSSIPQRCDLSTALAGLQLAAAFLARGSGGSVRTLPLPISNGMPLTVYLEPRLKMSKWPLNAVRTRKHLLSLGQAAIHMPHMALEGRMGPS